LERAGHSRGGSAWQAQLRRPCLLSLNYAMLGDRVGAPDLSPYCAPARATDLRGLPPAFIAVGQFDVFRNKDKLEALAGTLAPARTAVVPADVTREADVQALADEAAARFGGIDVLVSNAGVGYLSPLSATGALTRSPPAGGRAPGN
jgi:acetyl esterase/lipase